MRLKQIATVSAGYPFREKITEKAASEVIAIQMKDVSPLDGVDWPGCVSTKLTGKRMPDWLKQGDILIVARGSHNYAVLIEDDLANLGIRAVAAPYFYVIKTGEAKILPAYLAWFLNQAPCQRYFEQNAEGTLTKSIRRNVLENAPIALPALAKQQAVIQLAALLKREKLIAEQMLRNGEQLSANIANDLLANQTATDH